MGFLQSFVEPRKRDCFIPGILDKIKYVIAKPRRGCGNPHSFCTIFDLSAEKGTDCHASVG